MKVYTLAANVGKARYVVSYHDGVKTNTDGSPFFDVRIFSNRKKRDAFIRSLEATGHVPR